jgi:hypothetical protein
MAFTQIEAAGITSTGAVVLENATVTGVLTATSFSGSGASLITLNASNISSGTLPDARFPATLPAVSGANLTGISGIPSGTVISVASSTAPTGYLKTNGASLNTTTYATLFAAIGYTFGGSGASFTLPDLRGEFIRGWVDDRVGIDTGTTFGRFQDWSIENITSADTGARRTDYDPAPTGPSYHVHVSSGLGGGGVPYQPIAFDASRQVKTSTETRPRNRALLYCIKF